MTRRPLIQKNSTLPIRDRFAFGVLLLILIASPLTAYTQSTTATVSGMVEDQNGAVVPGVSITVQNRATSLERQATTNDDGYFTIPLLSPGTYTITARRDGFTTAEIRDVVLNVGDQKTFQVQLKTGDVNETINVTDEAPLINESPAVATTIDRQFVGNLPLNGRTFQSLIALTPGVVTTKSTFVDQGQFSVNGQRGDANYFTVDGVSANVGVSSGTGLGQAGVGALPFFSASGGTNSLVSVDALQEFKIQTSTYAPEFGRTPGAQVQILTRSGTNQFHGTLFEYLRNDALDATDWFVSANRLAKPALRQNQFGGVVGGPLPLPRFGAGGPSFYRGRDRTFFFFSYEGLRLRLPQTTSIDVPTLASRQDPNAPAAVRQILNSFPVPNGPIDPISNTALFTASYSDPSKFDSTSIRIDHNFTDRLSIFGRYNYAPSNTDKRGGVSTSTNQIDSIRLNTQTLTGGATWVISPSVNNEFRANWSKSYGGDFLFLDNFGGATPIPDSVLFPPPYSSSNASFIFILTNARRVRFTQGKNAENSQRQINLIDNLSVTSGSHQLKFGVDYRSIKAFSNPRNYGPLIFTSLSLFATGRSSVASISAFDSIGQMVNNFSAFVQDTWKASSRLTLTYGLRWELNPPPKGDGVDLFTVNGLENLATISLAPPGTPLYETTYHNFAPRFGVAYQMNQKPGRETVFRGGIGIFYDIGSQGSGNTVTSFPYNRSKSLPSTVLFPFDSVSAAPPPLTFSPPVFRIDVSEPKLKLPRTYQWNLTIEQSVGQNQRISAAYVGAAGRKLLQQTQIINPNANFQNIFVTKNAATSDYHAAQIQFVRRLARGFQGLASYTWSKSIDTVSNDFRDDGLARGPSDFDVRHAFSGAVTYDLPEPRRNSALRAIFGGWAVDGIVTARSATPFNIVARSSVNLAGFFQNIRPDLVQGIPLYLDDPNAPGGRRLNDTLDPSRPGCKGPFCTPPVGRQGTLGRNVVRSFAVFQADIAFRRKFNFTERLNLDLRAEAFNIFNHPNFADPVNSLASSLFGRSTQMLGRGLGSGGNLGGQNPLYQIGGPRSVQLVIKLNF
jgi:hypothetical protein